MATVFYRTPDLRKLSPAFRAAKKLYPIDPLLWHLIRAWAASDPDPWAATVAALQSPDPLGHLVESTVAIHLRRAFGGHVYYWRPDSRREIDFVFAPTGADTALLEVKYQHRVDDHDVRQVASAGGGFAATRSTEAELAGGAVYAIPAAELMLLLDTPSLTPSRA